MNTLTLTITQLKTLSTAKLEETLSKQNVLVVSSGKQISLISAVDSNYGTGTYGAAK